jgi:hypothetical protein
MSPGILKALLSPNSATRHPDGAESPSAFRQRWRRNRCYTFGPSARRRRPVVDTGWNEASRSGGRFIDPLPELIHQRVADPLNPPKLTKHPGKPFPIPSRQSGPSDHRLKVLQSHDHFSRRSVAGLNRAGIIALSAIIANNLLCQVYRG